MDQFTNVIAQQKLASLKKTFLKSETTEITPEEKEKLEKQLQKEEALWEKQKEKRQEQHDERARQREKLRGRIREKYNLDKSGDEKKSKAKPVKELKEKDFYKYNKAMPEERGKKKFEDPYEEVDSGQSSGFSKTTERLAAEPGKKDCIIS